MALTPLEIAILNLAELAAVEDAPPFAPLLRKPGGKPGGGGAAAMRLPGMSMSRPAKAIGED